MRIARMSLELSGNKLKTNQFAVSIDEDPDKFECIGQGRALGVKKLMAVDRGQTHFLVIDQETRTAA
jgi:hypothetical protein